MKIIRVDLKIDTLLIYKYYFMKKTKKWIYNDFFYEDYQCGFINTSLIIQLCGFIKKFS